MCGIFIIRSKKNTSNYIKKFKQSLNDIYLRGPDETKYIEKQNFLIGFTRLSINDLKIAKQPYESPDKRFTLLFNGEILNYKNLIKYLLDKNIVLNKFTETEVILKLFILHKEKFLNLLRGFFSIVIIDHKTNKIFACVDQYSVKPLYYFHSKDLLIFASNLSPILNNKFTSKNYDQKELVKFVVLGREINSKTIYKNIFKVKASTYLICDRENISTYKYWSPFKKKNKFLGGSYEELLSNNLDNLVNLWKTSDVKLSNTRSSGVDSNLLNFYFKKNNIFTKNFLIKENKHHQIKSSEIKIDVNDTNIELELDKYLKNNLDPTPVGVSSSLSLFNLYKNIGKRKFKVCFNGEGADELFGGYSRYIKHLRFINKRKGDLYKSFLDLYQNEIKFSESSIKDTSFNIYKNLHNEIKKIKLNSNSYLNKILEFDQLTWVPSVIKRHDAIGMHYSLEIRPPFLDQTFVNLVNSFPEKLKINLNRQKVIANKILFNYFNFKAGKTKMGTPSHFIRIINSKHNKKNLKEKIFYGDISKFYNPVKTWEICEKQLKEKYNHLFLWRIFILTKIFDQ